MLHIQSVTVMGFMCIAAQFQEERSGSTCSFSPSMVAAVAVLVSISACPVRVQFLGIPVFLGAPSQTPIMSSYVKELSYSQNSAPLQRKGNVCRRTWNRFQPSNQALLRRNIDVLHCSFSEMG